MATILNFGINIGDWGMAASDIILSDTYANIPAAGTEGRLFIPTDGPYYFRDDGSNWDAFLPSYGLVTVPPSSGWTADDPDAVITVDQTYGYRYVKTARSGLGHVALHYRTAPSTPYFIECAFRANFCATPPEGTSNNRDARSGMFFRDSTGKLISLHVGVVGNSLHGITTYPWTDSSTMGSQHATSGESYQTVLALLGREIFWLAIADDGSTNLTFYWSYDRQNWELFDTWARTAFFSSGPTQIGFGSYTGDSPTWLKLMHWDETGSIP